MTEAAFIGTRAQKDCFTNLGVEEYEFVATLDRRTFPICRSMDGKHFEMSDMKIGTNAPPLHPRCRSCTAPYFEDAEDLDRIARGENGDTYKVPGDMTYEQWSKKFTPKDEKTHTRINIEALNLNLKDVNDEYIKKATPGRGSINYPNEKFLRSHEVELKNAQYLLQKFGCNIKLLEEVNKDKVMTPDFVWKDKLWNLKVVNSEKAVDSAIRHGLKQIAKNPGGLLLQYVAESVDEKLLLEKINYRLCRSARTDVDIIVYKEDAFRYILRYIKK